MLRIPEEHRATYEWAMALVLCAAVFRDVVREQWSWAAVDLMLAALSAWAYFCLEYGKGSKNKEGEK